MPLTQLAPPYPIFTDKSGSPLDNGYLYFGTANLNPETNPITVYYDTAFTQPAAQPLRTSNGYVMRNGSPAAIYVNSYFSVTVRDKNKAMVIYSPSGYGITPGTSVSSTDQMTYNEGSTGAVNRTLTSWLQEYISVKDFGAVGNGVADDTVAFGKARDAAGIGGTVYVGTGTYKLSALVLSVANQTWSFASDAEVNSSNFATTSAIRITADGVTIDGGIFNNLAASTDAYALVMCLDIYEADDVTIVNGTYKRAVGPCILSRGCNRIQIKNNLFEDTWYCGAFLASDTQDISGVSVIGNIIRNTTVSSVYQYGINVHNGVGSRNVSDVVVANNQFLFPASSSQYPILIEVFGGLTAPGDISNVSVVGNTCKGGGMGISLSHTQNTTASANAITGAYQYGLEVAKGYNVTVSGNAVDGAQYGIIANGAGSGLSVSGNTVRNSTIIAVYLSQVGVRASVSGNTIIPTTGRGIGLLSTKKWVISGNILHGSSACTKAIELDKSDDGIVQGNNISDWTQDWLLIYANDAVTYDRISAVGNQVFSTPNSLQINTQLSGGAAIGKFISSIAYQTSADSTYRQDVLDRLNNVRNIMGVSSPEGSVTAGVGSIFQRTNGGASTSFYVKESGTGNTGWVAK
jgi:hypothetical protein